MKTINDQMTIKLIPDIFDEMRSAKNIVDLQNILLKNQSPALKLILQFLFNSDVDFTITELPAFKPDLENQKGFNTSSLNAQMRSFYVFTKPAKLSVEKCNKLMKERLEALHPSEIELVKMILDRNVNIPLLTPEVINIVFPGLIR